MSASRELDLRVVDTVLGPPEEKDGPRTVRARLKEGTRYYQVRIYLEGNDLPFVESVTYHLHPTFRDPHRTVERSSANPSCEIVVLTWGIFDLVAEIRDKSGRVYDLEHAMQYGEELRQKVKVLPAETPAVSAKPKLRE